MDEVWMMSLCLTFFAFVVALFSMRKSDEAPAKDKEQKSPVPVFSSSQPAARSMELTLEDIEKSLERLGAVLGVEPPSVKAACRQQAPASDTDSPASLSGSEEQPHRLGGRGVAPRGWAEHSGAESWSHPEKQGKEILDPPATQNIMEQIEQAVQETLDHNRERSEFIRVRRAPPAPQLETPPRDDMLQYKHPYSSD
ncbi:uncharacterized protein LOC144510715 isoform X2 [Mustelus asterias]